MQLVVILLPISSSSNDAISLMSFLTSGLSSSIISSRFSLPISINISAAASVSRFDTTFAAFFKSISFRYAPASLSSSLSSASDSISAPKIRYSFLRSWSVRLSIAWAMSLPW